MYPSLLCREPTWSARWWKVVAVVGGSDHGGAEEAMLVVVSDLFVEGGPSFGRNGNVGDVWMSLCDWESERATIRYCC